MSINSTGINESAVRMQNMALGLGSTQSSALNGSPNSPNFHIGNAMVAVGNLLESLTPLLMQFAQRAPMATSPQASPLAGSLLQQLPQLLGGLLSQLGMGGSPMMNPMGVGPQAYPMAPQAYPVRPQAYPVAPQAYPTAPQAYPTAPQAYPMGVGPQAYPTTMNPVMQTNPWLPQGAPTQFGQPGFQGMPGGQASNPNVPTVAPNTGETQYDAAGNVKMDKDRAVREIARNFDQLTVGKDNYVTKDDLKAIAGGRLQDYQKSANYTPELRAAAQYLLDNPEAFKELETSDAKAQGFKAKGDGKIGKGDTTAAMQKTSFSVGEKEAFQTLAKYGDQMFSKHHKLMNKDDLQKIVKEGKMPDGKPAPADLKDAAKLLLSQPETFSKLDNAMKIRNEHRGDQKGDGKFSLNDLREVMKGADTSPGPEGLKGGIFGNVNSNSLAGLILKGVNNEAPRVSQNTKDDFKLMFQGVPSDIRLT